MVPMEGTENCDGCGNCELACAFRAAGILWRDASAIRVKALPVQGAVKRYQPELNPQECDLCQDEPVPRCQRACHLGVLTGDKLALCYAAA